MGMKNIIEQHLQQVFSPEYMQVIDESHLHAGHAHAKEFGSHMAITVVSSVFEGKNRVLRHKSVYKALDEILNPKDGTEGLHALRMNLFTPEEWKHQNGQ